MIAWFVDLLTPALVILIGGLIAAIGAVFAIPNRRLKAVVAIGAFIVAVGTFWQTVEQNNYNKGGKSFCCLTYGMSSGNLYSMFILHKGKYPLYGLQIRAADLQSVKNHPSEILKASKLYRIDRLDPGFAQMIDGLDHRVGHFRPLSIIG
jgi:hypothetical protein